MTRAAQFDAERLVRVSLRDVPEGYVGRGRMGAFWREEEQLHQDARHLDPWQRSAVLLEVVGLYRAARFPSRRRYALSEKAVVSALGEVPAPS